MTIPRCSVCGYALLPSGCPICDGRTPGDRLTAPTLPLSLRGLRVTREMFVTPQHYEAWLQGTPLRRHLERRKKLGRDLKEAFFRGHAYQCAFCPSTTLLTLDHIVPQILGGSSNICNLRAACQTCNTRQWQPYTQYLRALDRFIAEAAA